MPYTVRARLRQRTAVLAALLVVVTGLQSAAAPAEYPFSAQIVFGYGEAPPARWTGSIRAENTRITKIKGWLFRNEDRISYEYPGAPRAPRSAEDKPIGGYREEGFLWSAYRKGYRLGTIASSDHWSTHISCAMFYTGEPARESIFEAIKKRRTYGATDNIVLDYRMGDSFMGEALTTSRIPPLKITAVQISWAEQRRLLKTREKASPKGCSGDQVAALDKIEIMLLSQLGLHSRQ